MTDNITLFSHILPEEQERMRVCFQAREILYKNNEIIMEYSDSMTKIGLILEGSGHTLLLRYRRNGIYHG